MRGYCTRRCEGRARTFQDLGQCPWVPWGARVVSQFPDAAPRLDVVERLRPGKDTVKSQDIDGASLGL